MWCKPTDNRDCNLKTKNFKDIMCAQDFQNQNFFNQINSTLSEFFLKIVKKYTPNRIISIWDVSKKYFLTFHNSCTRYNLLWKYISYYSVRNILWRKIPFNQFSKTPRCFSEFSATPSLIFVLAKLAKLRYWKKEKTFFNFRQVIK